MVVGSSGDLRVECVYGRSMIGSLKMNAGFKYDAWKKLKVKR
jgi:acyl-CoA-binding protein